MIRGNLYGGLCNQMFQIATTYAYAKRHGYKYGFDLDSCYTPNQGNVSSVYSNTIFKNIPNVKPYGVEFKYKESSFGYSEIPDMGDRNILLDGYFQSYKYFSDFVDDVKSLFVFPENIINNVNKYLLGEINNNSTTAIHVRRGDYLKHPNFHMICDKDYYDRAILEILKYVGHTNFILISDDINWCKNNFSGDNIYYSPFTNEIEDLYLISKCNNQIISNSTFSWWGAFFCEYNNTVIAPKKWFGPLGPKEQNDIIPNNWIKI